MTGRELCNRKLEVLRARENCGNFNIIVLRHIANSHWQSAISQKFPKREILNTKSAAAEDKQKGLARSERKSWRTKLMNDNTGEFISGVCCAGSLTNATGSYEETSPDRVQRRQARQKLAQARSESRLAGMKDKPWVSGVSDQHHTAVGRSGAAGGATIKAFHARLGNPCSRPTPYLTLFG